jgi:hypothetical protein
MLSYRHFSDLPACPPDVRCRGNFGRDLLTESFTDFDPERSRHQ